MNKTELADAIAETLGTDRKGALAAVEAVLGGIADNVAKGEKIALAGFGNFERVARDAREARNPATGQTVQVPATHVVKFKPASALKTQVAGG